MTARIFLSAAIISLLSFDAAFADMHEAALEHSVEAASGGLPQFDPTWFPSQIFWLAIAFGGLYWFFSLKTLPVISSVLENRRNHIQADLDAAEQLTNEAESVQESYEHGLSKARAEAMSVIQNLEQNLRERAAADSEAFRERSEREVKAAEDRIAKAKDKAMEDMSGIAAEVASQAVEKITGISMDLQKAKAVVKSLTGKAKAA